ncbi:unnamed protein product [Paramecium sonneborni]|uniref:Uncharacterized protein n=1 Tax=Paramecium sonneborni TaxID=65129 RepID=A0A8S1QE95_9CILI|nr:unnamed protein product [Paramecium sonneborni]
MGCGASKEKEKQIEEYMKFKILMQFQYNKLMKENKNKRKPVYVVADQEIDDLFVCKTDLNKRFEQIDNDSNKKQEFNYQVKIIKNNKMKKIELQIN